MSQIRPEVIIRRRRPMIPVKPVTYNIQTLTHLGNPFFCECRETPQKLIPATLICNTDSNHSSLSIPQMASPLRRRKEKPLLYFISSPLIPTYKALIYISLIILLDYDVALDQTPHHCDQLRLGDFHACHTVQNKGLDLPSLCTDN